MGMIAKILEVLSASKNGVKSFEAKSDKGGGDIVTGTIFQTPNTDSQPLKGDWVALLQLPQAGRTAAVGAVDPLNQQRAAPGEHIAYARDPESGEIVAEVHVENDGSVTVTNADGSAKLNADGSYIIQNANGSAQLSANGDFIVNGVTIDTNGNISTSGTVQGQGVTDTSNNVTLGTHNHGGAGPVPGS